MSTQPSRSLGRGGSIGSHLGLHGCYTLLILRVYLLELHFLGLDQLTHLGAAVGQALNLAVAVGSGIGRIFLDEVAGADLDQHVGIFHHAWHVQRRGQRHHDFAALCSLAHESKTALTVSEFLVGCVNLLEMHGELLYFSLDGFLELDQLGGRNLGDVHFLVRLGKH